MNNIACECSENERLLILRGLRYLTVYQNNQILYNLMIQSEMFVPNLFNLLQNQHISFSTRAETLWILTNLACENYVANKMIENWSAHQVIVNLFSNNIIKDNEKDPQLSEIELNFLE